MSTNWAYNDNVKSHFQNPKNVWKENEESFDADGKGEVGSPACGDMMLIMIKVKDNRISDFKWKTFGCASAIASTSALSEMVLKDGGMTLEEAYKITPEDIIKYLGGLPANKIHCSVLGDKALQAAIDDYFDKNKLANPFKQAVSEIICHCLNITEEDIRMEVLEGAVDFETLQQRTKISTVCGKCKDNAKNVQQKYIDKYYAETIYKPE
ncbi:MAG: iron-sulfur cluster assembly scaffold protein [Spirochaetes bacterium]|nr:iron-sulfur cluster assembly scaffold protein [Spirochaetota bacterium]